MSIGRVCSSCIDDPDIDAWIRAQDGANGCDACGESDSPTCDIRDLCRYIEDCLRKYWGFAVDQLPYDTAEGGYQGGNTWSTYALLSDEIELHLPRDHRGHLLFALTNGITDEVWCDYDWLVLDKDEALSASWDKFCNVVKHQRRFFFHSMGTDNQDSFTPASLLCEIADVSSRLGLINEIPAGTRLWRSRTDLARRPNVGAADFGPAPAPLALQSNRMNPPGIPMLYLASSITTSLLETKVEKARVGLWTTTRALKVLDLRNLPRVPGIFSTADRDLRLSIRFLHHFSRAIMSPVARDDKVHVEYLPSQVITEYFKDFEYEGGRLDGIAYGSTVHLRGWNLASFAGPTNLGHEPTRHREEQDVCFKFGGVRSARLPNVENS